MNFTILELNRLIEHAKTKYETAKNPEQEKYYKIYLQELRQEKKVGFKRYLKNIRTNEQQYNEIISYITLFISFN